MYSGNGTRNSCSSALADLGKLTHVSRVFARDAHEESGEASARAIFKERHHPRRRVIHTKRDPTTMRHPAIYILASQKRGTLYVGVTSDLLNRVRQHKTDLRDSFTSKYQVHRLVHFEHFTTMIEAISREKRLKKWERAWKIRLIEEENPEWKDLYEDL